MKHVFSLIFFCSLTPHAVATTSHADFMGSWSSEDQLLTKLVLKPSTSTDKNRIGKIVLSGACWQCGTTRNLSPLPVDSIAVLPVESREDHAESIELSLKNKDLLEARLVYRQAPEECRPPFHCQWVIKETKTVQLKRLPPKP